MANQENEIASLKDEIKQLRADLALSDKRSIASQKAEPAPIETANAPELSLNLCYKDYCPCEPPQGGPDQILCDQLEAGIDVDVQLMIAGRGMREARRQIDASRY
jgi:hypothetical protein